MQRYNLKFRIIIGSLITFYFLLFTFYTSVSVSAYHTEQYPDKVESRFIVTPTRFDLTLQPGQSISQKLTVINRLGRSSEFVIQKEGLIKDKQGRIISTTTEWIQPEIEKFVLAQGERMIMNVRVSVPEDVPSGGYYASVLVANEGRGKSDTESGIEIVSRVGVPLLIVLPGETIEKGIVTEFRSNKFFFMTGPAKLWTEFQNLGNVHLAPKGEITVRNFFGTIVAQMPVEQVTVLPNSEYFWETKWNRKWLLGRYDAELTLYYGNQNQKIERDITFYAFPWHIALLILLIIFLLYIILRRITEKNEARKKKKFDQEILDKVEGRES